MKLDILDNGDLRIDDAKIIFRNFSGAPSKFNREGNKNFALVIPDQELCDMLTNDVNRDGVGWNVKIRPPREEGDEPFMFLSVKVNFNSRKAPNVYLRTNGVMNKLDDESIAILDKIDIARVDLDITPSDGNVSGKPYRAAYLKSMCVTQDIVDRFADMYSE